MKIPKKIGSKNYKQFTINSLRNDHFLVTLITELTFIFLSILNFLTFN